MGHPHPPSLLRPLSSSSTSHVYPLVLFPHKHKMTSPRGERTRWIRLLRPRMLKNTNGVNVNDLQLSFTLCHRSCPSLSNVGEHLQRAHQQELFWDWRFEKKVSQRSVETACPCSALCVTRSAAPDKTRALRIQNIIGDKEKCRWRWRRLEEVKKHICGHRVRESSEYRERGGVKISHCNEELPKLYIRYSYLKICWVLNKSFSPGTNLIRWHLLG